MNTNTEIVNPGKLNPKPFTAAMIAGCEAALDADIFYQSKFSEFVLKHMGGFDCEAILIKVYPVDQSDEGFLKNYSTLTRNVRDLVKNSPRGHYALIEKTGPSRFLIVTSDGSGTVATGGLYNSYDDMPTGEIVLEAMISHEIYLCRKLVEAQRAEKANKEVMEQYRFQVGQTFKNLQSDAQFPSHKFSLTTISEVSVVGITLVHKKRGSKFLRTGVVTPLFLKEMIDWSSAASIGKDIIVIASVW